MPRTTPKHDLTGRVFGKWRVIALLGSAPNGNGFLWSCICTGCNTQKAKPAAPLLRGSDTQCGSCRSKANAKKAYAARITHGLSSGGKEDPTYSCWRHMITRCTNPNEPAYPHYGGRGIRVCRRWKVFENFLQDMGARPAGLTLERRNVNGNYTPRNCCWATKKAQAQNRRNSVRITYKGQTKSLAEWVAEYKIARHTARRRLARGLSFEDSFEISA